MTKTCIPSSAFHPKPRLKYRIQSGIITEWAKITERNKCLGWRPTNNAEFADSGMAELTAMEPLPRAFYFFHAVASAEHDRWTPSQAAEAWAFFNAYEADHAAQAQKVADLELAYILAWNELQASTEQADADMQELVVVTAALTKAKAPKTIETRAAALKAIEEKSTASAQAASKCEGRAKVAKATWLAEVAVLTALETRMAGVRPIMQRALDALRLTDAEFTQAA